MKKELAGFVIPLLLALGCGDGATGGNPAPAPEPEDDSIVVESGESIQDAVDAAPAGSRLVVRPGTYMETHGGRVAVLITKPLHLVADTSSGEAVRIVPGPGNTEGIMFQGTAAARVENVRIEGFTVEGFSENGIWPRYARDFEILNNTVIDSDHVGIYPYLSHDGLVKNNVAYGGLDSALWVTGSERIRVIENDIHTAPTGLEISASRDIEATDNKVYNNVVGIGLYHPDSTAADEEEDSPVLGRMGRFADNEVYENNLENPVTSGIVGDLPSGLGILILGADGATVEDNTVVDNRYAGIVLVDYCLASGREAEDCRPDDNTIINNTVTDNGGNPPDHPFADLASDILVLGQGDGNCVAGNVYGYGPTADLVQVESCP